MCSTTFQARPCKSAHFASEMPRCIMCDAMKNGASTDQQDRPSLSSGPLARERDAGLDYWRFLLLKTNPATVIRAGAQKSEQAEPKALRKLPCTGPSLP